MIPELQIQICDVYSHTFMLTNKHKLDHAEKLAIGEVLVIAKSEPCYPDLLP